tara:strand:+ start:66 stop:515 length:450 start_codon:yes stop_codon:yes gene_type:complete
MAETGNIGAAIFYILENDANTNAIYGRNIYPSISRVLTTSYPMVVYTLSDIAPTNTKTTPAAKGTSKLDVIQVQIAIFHDNYTDLIAGQNAVREALDYVDGGNYPPTGSNIVKLQSCSFQDMRQDYIDDYDEMGLYVSYMDYQFRQQRS